MKIVFLCSSLEFGKDGVGDYTRRLSGELIRLGHDASIIALHDRYLIERIENSLQQDNDETINTLRLSTSVSWEDKITYASSFIENQNPEWISLQYVTYGFQRKGLPFGLSSKLKSLRKGRKLHIMFHELWIGMDKGAPIIPIAMGWIQSRLIYSLIKKINPQRIHTQTLLYKAQLAKLGIKADYLPLFSNIPSLKLTRSFIEFTSKSDLSFVIFGSIHPGAPILNLAQDILSYSDKHNISTKFIFLGHNGDEKQHWVSILQNLQLKVEELGEQPTSVISKVLASASIGIATTPIDLIGKSGSAAAMSEHGLPIICISRTWYPRNVPSLNRPEGIFEYGPGTLEKIVSTKLPASNYTNLNIVANQFLKNLLSNL
ncbi:glycosyltransferase family 4 protein [Spirosoma sp. KCTC 42546]|uniref:glycosyltransferase family 4 protein n=1 Tax=Spirosoma sp. KCTC 42546 TaxID=2520506 RepID=UPI00115C05C1|nr:glycosyltransferase family 4 protein [Spirosoma sp. KCTC 42546]QDK78674.1 glycosyltransferase family 4 protein [Spirosoma sp. KCTC 42546]